MNYFKIIILLFLIIFNFVFINFPGLKLAVYGAALVVIINYIYSALVEKFIRTLREKEDTAIFIGINETISLFISNGMHLPIHALHIKDHLDLSLTVTHQSSFVVSFFKKGVKEVQSPIQGRKRGKYTIGPTEIHFTDIIGLFSKNYEIDTSKDVIVFPNSYPVLSLPVISMQPLGLIKNNMPLFEDPSVIKSFQDYQFGDEVKKINWKLSAKHGRIIVNHYQHTVSAGNILVFNLFEEDYSLRKMEYYIDRSIEVVSSVLHYFYSLKQDLGLMSNCSINNTDTIINHYADKKGRHLTAILSDLAVIETNKSIRLKEVLDKCMLNLTWGMSLYIFTPSLDEESLSKLIYLKERGYCITIINMGSAINRDLSLWNIGFQSYFADIRDGFVNFLRI